MKKLLIISLILSLSLTLFGFETYDRKSISILKVNIDSKQKKTMSQKDAEMISKRLYQSLVEGMKRFDFNPIPAGIRDKKELFKIVKDYTNTKIEERAAKQWDIKNDYYGTTFIAGENVDKIVNGAYIFFPTINTFSLSEEENKKDKKKYPIASLTIKLDIYSAENKGTKAQPNWEPKYEATVSATGVSTLSIYSSLIMETIGLLSTSTTASNASPEKLNEMAIDEAISIALTGLEKEVKKLDQFKIKTLVSKANPSEDKITFQFGKNMGVKIDDAYVVGYHAKTKSGKKKFVETGYLKVRKVRADASEAQLLIVNNPKNEKETNLFNEYDSAIEYPLIGLNIIPNFGTTMMTYVDDEKPNKNPDKSGKMIFALGLNGEYDLGKFLQIPELYSDLNIQYNFVPSFEPNFVPVEINFSSFLFEGGLKMKFFKRRFGFYAGGDYFYHLLNMEAKNTIADEDDDEDYHSMGAKLYGGINFLISKNIFIDASTGYRISGALRDEDGDLVEEGSKFEKDKWYTPKGFFINLGIGITL